MNLYDILQPVKLVKFINQRILVVEESFHIAFNESTHFYPSTSA